MRSVTIAGPDAEGHGRRNTSDARLDLWLAVLVAKIFQIDLSPQGKPSGHRCIKARAFESSRGQLFNVLRAGDDKNAQGPISHYSQLQSTSRKEPNPPRRDANRRTNCLRRTVELPSPQLVPKQRAGRARGARDDKDVTVVPRGRPCGTNRANEKSSSCWNLNKRARF